MLLCLGAVAVTVTAPESLAWAGFTIYAMLNRPRLLGILEVIAELMTSFRRRSYPLASLGDKKHLTFARR